MRTKCLGIVAIVLLAGGSGNVAGAEVEKTGALAQYRNLLSSLHGKPAPMGTEQFLKRFPQQPAVSLPPWDLEKVIHAAPLKNVTNEKKATGRMVDFALTEPQIKALSRNGFVVPEEKSSRAFVDAFLAVYVADLPVFVTADSILHAWHRSFDKLVAEIETMQIRPLLAQVVRRTRIELVRQGKAKEIPLTAEVLEALDFLDVADHLLLMPKVLPAKGKGNKSNLDFTELAEEPPPPQGEIPPPGRHLSERARRWIEAVREQSVVDLAIFGSVRTIDFSTFKPRGHYTKSLELQSYFRAMSWLSTMTFQLGKKAGSTLLTAAVIDAAMHGAGVQESWAALEHTLTTLIGEPDSLAFTRFSALLKKADFAYGKSHDDQNKIKALVSEIATMPEARPLILGNGEFKRNSDQPPSGTLAMLGQRFVLDSWAMGKLIYGQMDTKRTLSSGLDIAFTVLDNNAAAPYLARRMGQAGGIRDGFPIADIYTRARGIVAHAPTDFWKGSLYSHWLWLLQSLAHQPAVAQLPATQSGLWGVRTLNSQLGSWTELRHDTILYAKMTFAGAPECHFPHGFVEPNPEFWKRFESMVRLLAQTLPATQTRLAALLPAEKNTQTAKWYLEKQSSFLAKFSDALKTLRQIAETEVRNQPLAQSQLEFLKSTVKTHEENQVCTTVTRLSGWYPELFYGLAVDMATDYSDHIVADVQTSPASDLDPPGHVLHVGTERPRFLIAVVNRGGRPMVHVGPVYAFREFAETGSARLTDEEWKTKVKAGSLPPWQEWQEDLFTPQDAQ